MGYHEMAVYDVRDSIDYVLEKTGAEKLIYIGHSQGTMAMFAASSLFPDEIKSKVALNVMLAPVAFVGHLKSEMMLILAKLSFDQLVALFGVREIAAEGLLNLIGAKMCIKLFTPACKAIYDASFGPSDHINVTRFNVYISEFPAGASVKDFGHFAQGVRSDKFQQFDYGKRGNYKQYGTPTPPDYPLANITVPTALFEGTHDYLADPEDVQRLSSILSNAPGKPLVHEFAVNGYNHADLCCAEDASTLLFPDIIKTIARFDGSTE